MKYLLTTLLWLLYALPASAAEGPPARPNVIVILVDDMGFSDIGCYGGEIPTPNLDALAAGGLRFTQFYNTGRCCPTRAALLTGLYSHQAGVGHMTGDYGVPGYRGFLNDHCVTLGAVASRAGYLSTITGKWHVGHREISMYPLARGFNRFYGVPEGGGFYFQVKAGRTVVLNEQVVGSTEKPLPRGWYSTDAWTEYGLKFIDEALTAGKPFFLYLAHNAPHFPLQATSEDIARFRGNYREGWDTLSRRRHARQIELGLIDPAWTKAKRPDDVAAWDSLRGEEQDRFDHLMATYAACVYRMDRSIGTLVDGLKQRGQFENTLILFMSDNGGCAESGPRGKSEGDPTTAASNWFCGKSWAWMQDTPFRKFKHYNHEGGIATPLIVHWPKGIATRGQLRSQPAHVIDIMATLVDVTGAKYPTHRNGHAVLPMEGTSLRPAFHNEPLKRDALYWEHEGNAAIRRGDWKLVRLGGRGPWELYDLKSDRTEQHDLAAEKPELTAQLAAMWHAWAQRCNAAPNGQPRKRNAVPKRKARAETEKKAEQ
jgi:arylsulfatase A-like enzyme